LLKFEFTKENGSLPFHDYIDINLNDLFNNKNNNISLNMIFEYENGIKGCLCVIITLKTQINNNINEIYVYNDQIIISQKLSLEYELISLFISKIILSENFIISSKINSYLEKNLKLFIEVENHGIICKSSEIAVTDSILDINEKLQVKS